MLEGYLFSVLKINMTCEHKKRDLYFNCRPLNTIPSSKGIEKTGGHPHAEYLILSPENSMLFEVV